MVPRWALVAVNVYTAVGSDIGLHIQLHYRVCGIGTRSLVHKVSELGGTLKSRALPGLMLAKGRIPRT